MNTNKKRILYIAIIIMFVMVLLAPSVYVANAGEVSGAIQSTWKEAATQIKDVVDKVVFPVIDCVLAVLLFVKLAMSYFEYKKHGEFEFTPAAILFFGLVFALTAPQFIWNIVGV